MLLVLLLLTLLLSLFPSLPSPPFSPLPLSFSLSLSLALCLLRTLSQELRIKTYLRSTAVENNGGHRYYCIDGKSLFSCDTAAGWGCDVGGGVGHVLQALVSECLFVCVMYVYIYYMCAYMYSYTTKHALLIIHICTYIHTHKLQSLSLHVSFSSFLSHTHTNRHACPRTQALMHTDTLEPICTLTNTCEQKCTFVCTCTHTYTHTYTHT